MAELPCGTPRELIALATILVRKKDKIGAFHLARKALGASGGDTEQEMAARNLLSSLVSGYHVPIMNNAGRNAAWDQAIRNALSQAHRGKTVLEVGTGGGMLALMAARAGAAKVVTCELNPILATLAQEVMAVNGYGDTVDVVPEHSRNLQMGVHLQTPADFLVADLFADNLVSYDVLSVLADARRLISPVARVIPAAASIRVALCEWGDYARHAAGITGGFDISPLAVAAPKQFHVPVSSPDVHLASSVATAFSFQFDGSPHPGTGSELLLLEAERDCVVNGALQWIRLQLDDRVSLEACPQPKEISQANPLFFPFPEPVAMRKNDRLALKAVYDNCDFYVHRV